MCRLPCRQSGVSLPSFASLRLLRLCCCFVVQYCTVGIPTRLTVTVWGSGVSFTTTSPNKVVYQKIILRNSYFWRWPVPSQLVKLILRGCEKGFSWMPYGFAQSYMYSITEVLGGSRRYQTRSDIANLIFGLCRLIGASTACPNRTFGCTVVDIDSCTVTCSSLAPRMDTP